LACALELAAYPGQQLIAFSAGSDGIDGNTRAAGAIANTSTVRRALAFGYKPSEALATFNACPLFTALGDSVVTGPTGHNLRDLRLLISNPD
jgi:hydroxypyruvate reductase